MKLEVEAAYNYYHIKVDGESVGSTFCGKVGEEVVPTLKEMCNTDVNTIMGFSVRDEYQNQGIGTKLLEEVIRLERDKGTEYLNLGVRDDNEYAIKLYEKCGFKIEEDTDIFEGCYCMWLNL